MSVHPCVLPPQPYHFEEYPKWVDGRLVEAPENDGTDSNASAEDAVSSEEPMKRRPGRPRKNP